MMKLCFYTTIGLAVFCAYAAFAASLLFLLWVQTEHAEGIWWALYGVFGLNTLALSYFLNAITAAWKRIQFDY